MTSRPMVSLSELLARGGVHHGLAASSPREAVEGACDLVSLPAAIDRAGLRRAVVEREGLMSTGTGRGLALPHPRNHLPFTEESQLVSLTFLERPIDFGALDGLPVFALFLILSAEPRSHLSALAGISHLSRREDFHSLLARRPAREELLAWLAKAEAEWFQPPPKPVATR